MNLLAQLCLERVDWSALRAAGVTGAGEPATRVPAAVRRLAAAETADAARDAYWQLDNHVVVQGRLFEAAAPLVPVLLALLAGPLQGPARHDVANLLVEIVGPAAVPDLAEDPRLADECRRLAREGLWTIYGLLLDPDPWVRDFGLRALETVDLDRDRLSRVLATVAADDASGRVRTLACGILAGLQEDARASGNPADPPPG
jgi:hypothetical protein